MLCDECDDESAIDASAVLQSLPLHHVFSLLDFVDLLGCATTCKAWRDALADAGATTPWHSAFSCSFPAEAKLSTSEFRALGLRLLRRKHRLPHDRFALDQLQFAVTIVRNGTRPNPLWRSCVDDARVERRLPLAPVVEFAASLDLTRDGWHLDGEPREGAFEPSAGIGFDVDLGLPSSYPTGAAPDGRNVLLNAETLVATEWLEADWSAAACHAKPDAAPAAAQSPWLPRSHLEGSPGLELRVSIYRRSDGKLLCPHEGAMLLATGPTSRCHRGTADGALFFHHGHLPSPRECPVILKACLWPAVIARRPARTCPARAFGAPHARARPDVHGIAHAHRSRRPAPL